jgi:hypothetical protein
MYVRGVHLFQNRLAKEKWDALNDAIDAAPVVVPCQNTDPDVWFSDKDSQDVHSSASTIRQAKAFCKMCPVKQLCLEYAIVNDEPHGIWGGLSTVDRRKLRNPSRSKI